MEAIREDSHDPGRDDDDDDERVIGQYRRDVVLSGKSMVTHSNIVKLKLAGRSCRVVSAFGCDVRGTKFESHRGRLCLSRQPLRYTALGTGCEPLLQCLGDSTSILRGTVK